MNSYTFVIIPARGSKAGAPVETVDCANDAQALGEACKAYKRVRAAGVIEVWADRRKVVSLGGRRSDGGWTN